MTTNQRYARDLRLAFAAGQEHVVTNRLSMLLRSWHRDEWPPFMRAYVVGLRAAY